MAPEELNETHKKKLRVIGNFFRGKNPGGLIKSINGESVEGVGRMDVPGEVKSFECNDCNAKIDYGMFRVLPKKTTYNFSMFHDIVEHMDKINALPQSTLGRELDTVIDDFYRITMHLKKKQGGK